VKDRSNGKTRKKT